ncbi:MAG TPA: heterodisulfide reductase-related iron-sulfur binding cluster [Pyrinomonadaceae bacterium]|nr:heterodisulfide reductase-related iron-sulfur binding cluster [Pyrinomonadaceae bacterium]
MEDKLLACIHCGLCLEACPTYVVTGDENDGPRGRIYLMRAVAEGRLPSQSPTFERHINRCLGCRACEPVCPAGVEYGQLLEGAREVLLTSKVKPGPTHRLLQFILKHVWLHSARLRFLFTSGRLLRDSGIAWLLLKSKLPRLFSKQVEFGLTLLESSKQMRSLAQASSELQSHAAVDDDRERVLLFTGCVTEGLFSRVNRATAKVLQVNGCSTKAPTKQACCGALHAHAGDLAGARQLAKRNIEAFTDSESASIITNAGGCGAMLASYSHLFAEEPEWSERARNFSNRVRDISQQLRLTGIKAGAPIGSMTVTYDASCHLINGQHVGEAPLDMLRAIPNLNFVPLTGSDRCCGGAGVYNLVEPELSTAVLNEKLSCIRDTGATLLATGNPGCHMQIHAGAILNNSSLDVCHPVELLDQSYRNAGLTGESEAKH